MSLEKQKTPDPHFQNKQKEPPASRTLHMQGGEKKKQFKQLAVLF